MARLPQPGSDDGQWGNILNDYLSQSLSTDGSLRPNTVGSNQLQNQAVTSSALADGVVTPIHLVDGAAPQDGQVLTYSGGSLNWGTSSGSGTIPDASGSTKGVVQLTADFGGTATSPQVAKINGVTVPSVAPTSGQVLTATGTSSAVWSGLPAAPVTSVASKTGNVTLVKGDVGLGNVDNTADTDKPISTLQASALAAKAPLASPALTGVPTSVTASDGTNTTQIATTAFVTSAVTNAAMPDATTAAKGKVQLADSTDVLAASGNDVLSAGLIPSSQGVTGIAKVQFIPKNGTVTGSPGAYTIIIEAGS